MPFLDILERVEKVYTELNPLEAYKPHNKIKDVISFFDKETEVIVIFAANGWGKTTFISALTGNIMFGCPNKHFHKNEFLRNWPKNWPKTIRIGSAGKNIEEDGSLHEEITKWWPKDKYERLKGGKQYYSIYKANGWVMDILSYDMEDEQFDTGTIGLCICDHPPPKSKYDAMVGRMRKGGIIIILVCPTTGVQWMDEEIISRADGKKIKYLQGDIYDNHIKNGGVLTEENIQKMLDLWDPAEIEARAHGKPLHLVGRVYDIFDREVHLYKDLPESPDKYTWYFFLDPHDRRPPAMIWAGINETEDIYGFAEAPVGQFHRMKSTDYTIEDTCKAIKQREADLGINVKERYCDPHWQNKVYPNSRLTISEEYASHNIYFQDLEVFHELGRGQFEATSRKFLKELLKYDKESPLSNSNHPKLYIKEDMWNTIYSFYHYVWDEYSGKKADKKDISGKPQKKNKCFTNLFEYLSMADIKYVPMGENYSGRQFEQFSRAGRR